MEDSNQSYWIPLSDLMMGLMSIFLVISIISIAELQERAKVSLSIAKEYEGAKINLTNELNLEFRKDFPRFGAEFLSNMIVRFNNPDVLFDSGSHRLSIKFKQYLSEFFPRYISILTKKEYRDRITEIRIEGHTSFHWEGAKNEQEAYFKNMELSQARTRSTLEFLLSLNNREVKKNYKWLKERLTANGLSSSKPVAFKGKIDSLRSQRVEFRIVADSDKMMSIMQNNLMELK